MIKLVIDMMGSDKGSSSTIEGVKSFLKTHDDVTLICVGRQNELSSLSQLNNVQIVNADDVLPMAAHPLDALRAKNSSMMVAIQEVLDNDADGIVSSGGTGAFLTASSVKLKKIEGVLRPALISPFPTKIKGKKVCMLDIGASNENSPEELVQFAHMGRLYAINVMGIKDPKTFILSNGTEEEKGSPSGKEAFKLLKAENFPSFCGNIEGREVLSGEADVVVSDGFSGNICLKTTEGIASMFSFFIKNAFKKNIFSKIGYLLSKKGFKEISQTMDYKSTGGAILLGVNKIVVKAHGNSDGFAFMSAINVAYAQAKIDVISLIKDGLKKDSNK